MFRIIILFGLVCFLVYLLVIFIFGKQKNVTNEALKKEDAKKIDEIENDTRGNGTSIPPDTDQPSEKG